MALAAWALGALAAAPAARASPVVRAFGRDWRSPARVAGTPSRCSGSTASRTGRTTRRSATCATASPRCSCPPAVLIAIGVRRDADPRVLRRRAGRSSGTCRSSSCSVSVCSRRLTARVTRAGCGPSSRSRCSASRWRASTPMVGAPDVALVAVLVETVLTLVFVGVFARLPPTTLRRPHAGARATSESGLSAGVAAFATIWGALSRPGGDRRRRSRAHRQDA